MKVSSSGASPSIEAFVSTKGSANTRASYRFDLVKLERFLGKELHPEDTSVLNVQAYIDAELARGIKPRTVERAVHAFNNYRAHHGLPGIRPRVPAWTSPPKVVLTPEEVRRLMEAATGEFRAVLELLYSGLTVTEALTAKYLGGGKVQVFGRHARIIPVSKSVVAWLNWYPPPYTMNRFHVVLRAQKLTGTRVTLDGLRYSFAVHLAQAGATAATVSALLGTDFSTDTYFAESRKKASPLWHAIQTLERPKT